MKKAGPITGRYRFLSLNKSARGKKLLVIEIVRINQRIENGIVTGNFLSLLIISVTKDSQNKTGTKTKSKNMMILSVPVLF